MKNLIFVLVTFAFFGCKVTFTPAKSPAAIDLLNSIQTNATAIFTSTDLTYAGHETDIINVNNQIDSLMSIDLLRKKALLINQDQSILTEFNELASEFKNQGTITSSVASNYNAYFKSFVHGRLISENSLK